MDLNAPPAPDSLQESLGQVRVLQFEPGRARIEYRCGLHMCHSGGVAQGGFVHGWIDAAMAHAIMAQTGAGMVPMTLEMKTSYFAPTRPGLVVAEGWIESGKGRSWFVEGRLLDPDGKVLAKASSTVRLVELAAVTPR